MLTWLKAYGFNTKFFKSLRPSVNVGSLAGAIYAVIEGAGIAILPNHCVKKELTTGGLITFKKSSSKVATLPIQFVRKVGTKLPRSAELVIDALKATKSESY